MIRRAARAGLLALMLAGLAWAVLDNWVRRTVLPDLVIATSTIVTDRDGAVLRAYTIADGRWRLPVMPRDVDPRYVAMLLAYEDRRYHSHSGVDPRAAARAAWQLLRNGRIVSGASTLTMQVARLLEDGETGDLRAKLRQIRVALALERALTKDQILTLYLHLAPMGGNIEGVRAASLTWFGREPSRLTPAQAALLVALPQSPALRRPDRNPNAALNARNRVLERAVRAGVLDAETALAAQSEPLPGHRIAFPALAPHLADRLLAENPGAAVIATTLSAPLQAALQDLARAHAAATGPRVSAALIVADHASGAILAEVGSADLLDQARLGFVDMTRAVRSPGSTLKPLIYGLAFENGLAHPDTMIEDRPMSFGGYAPRNFEGGFMGLLDLRRALQLSLNIPAVALLDAVGPAQLLARIRLAGVVPMLPRGQIAGLSIALGGLGLTLHDLVTLQAALARGGQPVRLSATNLARLPANPILSPAAAWQVSDILAGTPRPPLAPLHPLAYKTGTSYGYRDAWAIGHDGRHVIGVWLGRPDGGPVPGMTGLTHVAPLLFEAFGHLPGPPQPLPPPPSGVLFATEAPLPAPLRMFVPRGADMAGILGPSITFPPDGARLDLGSGTGDPLPLVIKLQRGTPPFVWLLDGNPLRTDAYARDLIWPLTRRGFVTVSVIDSRGLSSSVQVFVE